MNLSFFVVFVCLIVDLRETTWEGVFVIVWISIKEGENIKKSNKSELQKKGNIKLICLLIFW